MSSSLSGGIGQKLANSININGGNVKAFKGQYWRYKMIETQRGPMVTTNRPDLNSEEDLNISTQAAYDYIVESRENNCDGKVIVYGYSWGGVLANHLADRLKEANISVDKLIIVDAAVGPDSDKVDRTLSENAKDVDNYYTPDRSNTIKSFGDKGMRDEGSEEKEVKNIVKITFSENGKKKKVTHSNINEATFDEVLKSINTFLNN